MINFGQFNIILENLKKVTKNIKDNFVFEEEDIEIINYIYNYLNKRNLAKPLYVSWIFSIYLEEKKSFAGIKRKAIKWKINLPSATNSLYLYDQNLNKFKGKKELYNKEKKEFNYKTIEVFADFLTRELGFTEEQIIMNDKDFIIKKEATLIFENQKYKVIQILSENAANYYGKTSKWCTVNDKENYTNYAQDGGELYVIFNKELISSKNPNKLLQYYINVKTSDPLEIECKNLDNKESLYLLYDKDLLNIFLPKFNSVFTLTLGWINQENSKKNLDRINKVLDGIKFFKNIKEILLNGNNLKSIPSQIKNINFIEYLSLLDNKFEKVEFAPKCKKLSLGTDKNIDYQVLLDYPYESLNLVLKGKKEEVISSTKVDNLMINFENGATKINISNIKLDTLILKCLNCHIIDFSSFTSIFFRLHIGLNVKEVNGLDKIDFKGGKPLVIVENNSEDLHYKFDKIDDLVLVLDKLMQDFINNKSLPFIESGNEAIRCFSLPRNLYSSYREKSKYNF